jgi:putative DNA primase/helicase
MDAKVKPFPVSSAAPDDDIRLDPRDPMQSARRLVAERFTDAESRRTLHHHMHGFWNHHGGCYRSEDDDVVRAAIWKFLDGAQSKKGDPFKPTRAKVSDVFDALKAICGLPGHISPPAWIDDVAGRPQPAELLALANGLLHLPTGILHPSTPDFFGLSASGVEFDPTATSPLWLTFLAQLFGDDVGAIEALQEWFGYVLAPDTSQQKMMLIVGPKRSGKGTIARVIRALCGVDSVAGPTLASLSQPFGTQPLIGKPLAIISDARLSARTDPATIAERLLTISGEDAVTIDRKHREAWTGRLPTRFMILTNELPKLSDSSGALASRFIVIKLRESFFGREDPGLTARLLDQLPGILNWARDGYISLRSRQYFRQPESSRDAIDELETLAAPVAAFVRECCQIGAGRSIPCGTLFEAWRNWCDRNGRKDAGALQTFSQHLKAAYPAIETKQRRILGDRERFYEGIDLA